MGIQDISRSEMAAMDQETLRWLLEFSSWKRRKAARPEDVHLRFLLDYIALHETDYYFIHRNYTSLVPLLKAYSGEYGDVEGLTRLIGDLQERLKG